MMKKTSYLSLLAAVLSGSLMIAGPSPQSKAHAEDPDMEEVTSFRLNSGNFGKFETATTAIMKLMDADPAFKDQYSTKQQNKSLAQSTDMIDKEFPKMSSTIHSAGLSTHEYVVMTATVLASTMAVGMKKQGMIKEMPAIVSPSNAAFVEQNYEKVSALMKATQQHSK